MTDPASNGLVWLPRPTESGDWWLREDDGEPATPVSVSFATFPEGSERFEVYFLGDEVGWSDEEMAATGARYEWAPLVPPPDVLPARPAPPPEPEPPPRPVVADTTDYAFVDRVLGAASARGGVLL